MVHRTRVSGIRIAAAMEHTAEVPEGVHLDVRADATEDWARTSFTVRLQPGQCLVVDKLVAYGWSARRSLPAVRDQVAAALTAACSAGWDELVAEQREYLDAFWERADVEVDGDPELQQAVRFSLFHVLQAGARAERRPIAAKGLTGPGYDGHAFWDTETFVLPVLTATVPGAAADALRWRHATLPQAHGARGDARPAGRRLPVAHDRRQRVLRLLARRHSRASTSTPTSPTRSSGYVAGHRRRASSSGRSASSCWCETARLWMSLGHHDSPAGSASTA